LNSIFAAALEMQQFCRERGWRACVIGGVAVQRWGEPRGTQDVDVTVFTGFGTEESYVDALLEHFEGRRPDARDFALRYRVALVRGARGVPIDVALGAMPFEERAVVRATDYAIGSGTALRVCSAEDLVVMKAFAGRERDWLDIEGVLLRQHGRLDLSLVWAELMPLLELKEDTEAAGRLRRLVSRASE
jgi:hypothetical protein